MNRKDQRGFTLMELMVVIVIVAILAAVAVPLYINYVKDAQRTEAKGAIGAIITAEQTFYQREGKYTSDTMVKDPSKTPGAQILNCDLTEALNNWNLTIVAAADGFEVNATNIKDPTLTQKLTYSRATGTVWDPN